MNYRTHNLIPAQSILTAGTLDKRITGGDPISRILVIVRLTNNSWTPTGHPAKAITNIQLKAGNDVLFGMRGQYAQAMSFYGTKRQPHNYINYTDNGLAVAVCPIDFGRRLWDDEFALKPEAFDNLTLYVTHNYALGGAVPNAATVEVWVDYFDDKKISPSGFMTAQSIWAQTLVASTKYPVDLPVDFPMRLVCPAVSSGSEEPDINIASVKLTENAGKKELLNMDTLSLLQSFETLFPLWAELGEGRTLAANNVSFFITPAKDVHLAAFPSEDLDNYINFPWSGGQSRYIMGSATTTINFRSAGRCPHGVIPIPMGDLDTPTDWWEPGKAGDPSCQMVTGAGDTSALFELLVQQARRY